GAPRRAGREATPACPADHGRAQRQCARLVRLLTHAWAFIVVRSWRCQAPTVLPRATTSLRNRVQTGANAARLWSVKSLQGSKDSEAPASRRERRGRLDKLGVTGSSPVPPIEKSCKSAAIVFCPENGLEAVLP